MSKSTTMRVADYRAILQLIGECRELGDDARIWRLHFCEQLARLVDSDVADCGEMVAHAAQDPTPLDVCHWGYENWSTPAVLAELFETVPTDAEIYGSIRRYLELMMQDDGVCCCRSQVVNNREWYKSPDYQIVHRSFGMDHNLWCFRSIPSPTRDQFSGLLLYRALGRRDYSARDRLVVREAHAALAPLIGGALARFSEPSPMDLAPRVREVLGCLLEGDSDKQIAARLGMSKFTVNQYTKLIYTHFSVSSRAELLARWIRRGWGQRMPWFNGSRT
jgi:DNA-binding CsgD family transcriptional regulator